MEASKKRGGNFLIFLDNSFQSNRSFEDMLKVYSDEAFNRLALQEGSNLIAGDIELDPDPYYPGDPPSPTQSKEEVDYKIPPSPSGSFQFLHPLKGKGRISSKFGMRLHPVLGVRKFHAGVDFASPTGTPIYATERGVVSKAGVVGGYGNLIEIIHDDKFSSRYGHCSKLHVKTGDQVIKGQLIGEVGTTGRSTGPHLHFEIRIKGNPVDPLGYV